MKITKLAEDIARLERGRTSISIAQIKEVLRIINDITSGMFYALMKILPLVLLTLCIAGPRPAYAGGGHHGGHHGHQGPAGPQGPAGEDGADGTTGAQGIQGVAGVNGRDGQDCDRDTKVILGGDVRIWDLKHASLHFFDDYNWMDRHNDSFGVRVMFKLGDSYEQRELAKQSAYTAAVVAAAMEKSRQNDAEIGELKMRLKQVEDNALLSRGRGSR